METLNVHVNQHLMQPSRKKSSPSSLMCHLNVRRTNCIIVFLIDLLANISFCFPQVTNDCGFNWLIWHYQCVGNETLFL